jgi:hypothetical protein
MRTRAIIGALVVVGSAVGLVAGSRAQDAALPPTEYTTKIMGTAPKGIDGRWFTIAHLMLPDTRVINVAGFLDVRLEASQPTVTKRYVKLPDALQQAFEAANAANQAWTPSPDDVRAVAAAWDELPPDPQGVATLETDVFSPDAFDETITGNPGMDKARWAFRQKETFHGGGNRPVNQVMILTSVEDLADGWRGPYASVTVAAAPFPVPIAFNGTADIHRLDETAGGGGFLARFFDMFSGCGR